MAVTSTTPTDEEVPTMAARRVVAFFAGDVAFEVTFAGVVLLVDFVLLLTVEEFPVELPLVWLWLGLVVFPAFVGFSPL